MHKNHTIWIWKTAKGEVRYVGYGRFGDIHPALLKWHNRAEDDSELGAWLRDYAVEPTRERYGDPLVSKETARAMVMGLRGKYGPENMLNARGPSSYSGGGDAKGVYYLNTDKGIENIEHRVFSSVREAAREVGKHPSTVTRWCQDVGNAYWGYYLEE